MSRRQVKGPKERLTAYWSANVGDHGSVVHVSERPERGHALVFRWNDATRPGVDKRVRYTSELTVRDESGAVDSDLVKQAMAEAKNMSLRLALGMSARELEVPEAAQAAKLSVRAGFDLVLDPIRGKYNVEDSRRVVQVKAYAKQIVNERLLPAAWVDHKRTHYLECWRGLARRHKNDPKVSGPRHAEMLTDAAVATVKWLIAHDHLPEGTFTGWDGWRGELRNVFSEIAPNGAVTGQNPRHSADELADMFRLVCDPRSRLYDRLLPLVITDQREEALANAYRSSLDLRTEVATLYIEWSRQRRDGSELPLTRTVTLPTAARALLQEAITTGHLRALEAEFQSDGVDYPLFPTALVRDGTTDVLPLTAASPSVLDIDPRIRLAVELGGELRVGQVLTCTRRALSLEPTEFAPYGVFRVRGNPIKPGETVVLSKFQRAEVDHALATYLSLYERSYDPSDATTDYPLFPSGQLSRRVALPPGLNRQVGGGVKRRNGQILAADGARRQFRVLERVAGVSAQADRAWYGIRRGMTDVAPNFTSDVRELDAMGGWTPGSSTRRKIYEDGKSLEVRANMSEKRDLMRGHKAVESSVMQVTASPEMVAVLALLKQMSPEERKALRDGLGEA